MSTNLSGPSSAHFPNNPAAVKRVIPNAIPKIKASTGITYQHLQELVEKALATDAKPTLSTNVTYNSQLKRVKALMDGLYNGVRLEAWASTTVNDPAQAAYSLPVGTVSVMVTDFTVELSKGMRRFPIAGNFEAHALFVALQQAQAVILAMEPPVEVSDDEYFCEHDLGEEAQIIDDMLREPEDEAADVKAHFSQIAAQTGTQPPQEGEQCSYCEKYNAHTYKGQCPQCPKKAAPDDTLVMAAVGRGAASRLKSLQGRVLGIVDAAIADKEQRNAVKTLINKEFRRDIGRLNSPLSQEDEE